MYLNHVNIYEVKIKIELNSIEKAITKCFCCVVYWFSGNIRVTIFNGVKNNEKKPNLGLIP